MKIGGIYIIRNLINEKIYIGSTINFKNRFYEHKKKLKKNEHHSYHLQNAWNKYGEENFIFEIQEEIENKNLLLKQEQHWMDYYKSYKREFGYNISPSAKNSLGCKRTLEQIEKQKEISISVIKDSDCYYNSKLTLEQAEEIRNKYKNDNVNSQMLAEEYGISRSVVCRILNYKSYIKKEDRGKEFEPIKKKKLFSPKTKQNLSKAHIGIQANEKHPQCILNWIQVREIRSKYKPYEYSMNRLAKEYNVSLSCIFDIIRGKNWKEEKV